MSGLMPDGASLESPRAKPTRVGRLQHRGACGPGLTILSCVALLHLFIASLYCTASSAHPASMSDGFLNPTPAHPAAHSDASAAPPTASGPGPSLSEPSRGLLHLEQPVLDRVHAPAPAYENLAQQMQVFLSRTDLQHTRKNKFVLQQTLESLAELDQHLARETHLQTALQDTQAQIVRLKQKLVDMAADSVHAEHEALSIAQARAHLATLLHDKLVHEFK